MRWRAGPIPSNTLGTRRGIWSRGRTRHDRRPISCVLEDLSEIEVAGSSDDDVLWALSLPRSVGNHNEEAELKDLEPDPPKIFRPWRSPGGPGRKEGVEDEPSAPECGDLPRPEHRRWGPDDTGQG